MTQSAVTKVLEPVIRKLALSSEQLGPQLDEASILDALDVAGYSSTFIGQDRAKAALGFAIGMDMPGYNLCVIRACAWALHLSSRYFANRCQRKGNARRLVLSQQF
ncbi:MAG: hypothetical protein U5L01_09430 [Rheinheimera sp.]|nr:hypothetical protein [Rheinheimera sp.]